MKKRILSGMQSSGRLHLGNLLGALENWVKLQDEYECYYFVADWHALSANYQDTAELKGNVIDIGVNWLASGLDPEKSTLFVQSLIPEHAVLHLLFSMITPIPWLERVPSYKEKLEQVKDRNLYTYGFLGYPVLQAADIVIYKAHYVPVGIDQLPHIELTREIVRRFHEIFKKKVFVEPEGKLAEVKKLPGVDGRKMSKSYNNAIYLSDLPDERAKKISNIVTDPARVKRTDKGHPEVCVAFAFHQVFTPPERIKEIEAECKEAGIGCVDCKKELAKNVASYLSEFDEKRAKWAAQPKKVMEIFNEGTERARKIAKATLAETQDAIGLSMPKF